MKRSNSIKILLKAALKVAIFLIIVSALQPQNISALNLAATKSSSLSELEKKKEAEKARAERAKQLKEKQEQQAKAAKDQVSFLENQITEIKTKEQETQESINSTEKEIANLSSNISVAEQKAAEEKRRILEAAKSYFIQRRGDVLDVEYGELDVLMGEDLSEKSSHAAQYEAVTSLLRQRMTDYIRTKVQLDDQKSVAEGQYKQLANLKSEQSNLRRAKQSTQVRYSRLATFSQQEAEKYEQEMEDALRNASYWEQKILAELTRIINARKSGGLIPRTGASVGQRVKKSEVIGHQGNTGYSTGSHLHGEIRLNNSPVNPRSYFGGSLDWPLEGDFRVTQEFGVTPYSKKLYSSGVHTGIDLTKYDGANVYAACSGEVILDSVYGGYGRAFAHTCDDTELVVLYGHLQSE